GRKQVFRAISGADACYADHVGLADETAVTAAREFRPTPVRVETLLETQMEQGRCAMPRPTIEELRARSMAQLQRLDPRLKAIRKPAEYLVRPTAALNAMLISEKLRAEKRQS